MEKLNERDYYKVNTITTEQYAWKGKGDIIIEHSYSAEDTRGVWTYYGGSIWDSPPKFNKLTDLLDYLDNK